MIIAIIIGTILLILGESFVFAVSVAIAILAMKYLEENRGE